MRPREQLVFSEIVAQLTVAFSDGSFLDILSVERMGPSLALVKGLAHTELRSIPEGTMAGKSVA